MGVKTLRKAVHDLKASSDEIRSRYNAAASRTLHLAGISGAGNILLGVGKIISGVLSRSVFICVNGCYTLGMVLARYCALASAVREKEETGQYRYYRRSGMILIGASLLYMAYSSWACYHPKRVAYHEYVALAIAAVTFTEIGLNIRGVLLNRKNRAPLLHAIKTINLAASLISLVLTQSAILAFTEGGNHDPAVNALLGLMMGGCAALLGVYMLWRIGRMERTRASGAAENYDHENGGYGHGKNPCGGR